MSNKPLQVRILRDDARGADLAAKLEKIAKQNSLSLNSVVNMACAAGLSIVELKLREIHTPEKKAA